MLKPCTTSRALALVLFLGTCFAQAPESSKFYKLDFVVKEVEGTKVLNARSYSMIVSTEQPSPASSIRAGSRVPIFSSPGSTQYTYTEVGVNIDCRSAQQLGNELSLVVTADITSTAQDPATASPPVLRQNKWNSIVVVPIRKPLVVFSSDDATSKRQMQLELTATPIR